MGIFDVDWRSVWAPDIAYLESFIRGTLLYFFVFIIFTDTFVHGITIIFIIFVKC